VSELLQFVLIGLTMGVVYGVIGLGYTIVYNATDTVNFAHGEYVMLGGMLTAVAHVDWGWPVGLAAFAAIAAVTLLGAVTKLVTVPREGTPDPLRVILLTLALAIVIRSLVLIEFGKDPRFLQPFSSGPALDVFGATLPRQSLWVLGVATVVVGVLALFYQRSRHGQAMLAASFDPYAARLMGVNVSAMVLISFALSAAIGATAGIVVAPLTSTIYNLGIVMGIKGFVAAAIGGVGSAKGTILGGLVLGVGESLAAGYVSSGYKSALGLVVGLAVLLLRPHGLFGGATAR
jgi:branched-chain amino acid transport system permease protein